MRDDRAAAFADDDRMGDLLRVAHVHDVVDDVARVLVERVVRRAVEGGARAVVIDAEAAADIEVPELVPHLRELRVKARRFAHRALDRADVRDLRADVEVDELERVREPFASSASRSPCTRSAVLRPNFAFSPPLVAHLPAPFAESRTRMPIIGSTPISFETARICVQLLELLDDHDDLLARASRRAARSG